MEQRTDPRVRRTRAALRQALVGLADDHSLSDLSVARVAATAGVSRQTFYAHYHDLDELTVAALREEFEDVRAISRAAGELTADARDPASLPPGLARFARFLHQRRRLLARALGPDGSPGFAHWLRELVTADVADGLRQRPERVQHDVPLEVQARFVAGAILDTLLPVATAAPPVEPVERATQLWGLLRHFLGPDAVTAATDG